MRILTDDKEICFSLVSTIELDGTYYLLYAIIRILSQYVLFANFSQKKVEVLRMALDSE